MIYKISEKYTDKPGGRYKKDGMYSGEDFRETQLKKLIKQHRKNGKKIVLDFDGGYGYGNSFLEESFGGLVRCGYSENDIFSSFTFVSNEEPSLIEKIKSYISEAKYEKTH